MLNPFDFFLEPDAELSPFTYDHHVLDHELAPFLIQGSLTPRFEESLQNRPCPFRGEERRCPARDFRLISSWLSIKVICHDIKYLIRLEPGVQTPSRKPLSAAAVPAATQPG